MDMNMDTNLSLTQLAENMTLPGIEYLQNMAYEDKEFCLSREYQDILLGLILVSVEKRIILSRVISVANETESPELLKVLQVAIEKYDDNSKTFF